MGAGHGAGQAGGGRYEGGSSGQSTRVVFHVATGSPLDAAIGSWVLTVLTPGIAAIRSRSPGRTARLGKGVGSGAGRKARYTRIQPRAATSCEEPGRGRVSGGVMKGTIVPLPAPWPPDVLSLAGTSGQAE